ncbi:G-type lectin S-receptor-like serine/threonine-protein kinase At2g19130 [Bidens hawaiensis]|uniref:G-type lectin S-receptor-like serine/threonine-protein kinase At2g19130 n=1 Tax=Bidens hawaiensis TaxID=980011 RepID=UPI004049C45F
MCFTNKLKVLMGFIYFLCLSLTISFSFGDDTISANNSLSGDETIISKGELFELGFFKAGNSSNYYIGIWYKKYSSNIPTIVWVANRETPVYDRFSAVLKVVDGNLVLLNESKLPIWSTNVTSTTGSDYATAVILDDGNLVLRNSLNSVEPVWQSFDHPTHTWLSGAKFAYNKRTNKSQLLTSWKSTDNPAVGLYSFELVPSQKMFVNKWNGSQRYWDTGSWDPLMINDVYNFSYQTNENESYFTYASYNPSFISRFLMDVSGQLQQQTWLESTKQWNVFWAQPETRCQVYGLCGAFGTCRQTGFSLCNCLAGFEPRSESEWNRSDFSGGCVRKTNLTCGRNMEKPDFLVIKVTRLPPNSYVTVRSSSGECRTSCLNNCSCNAYSFVSNSCSVWDGELLNLSEDNANGRTMYVKVSSNDLPSHKKNNGVTTVAVVASVGGLVLVFGLVMIIVYTKKRRFARKTTMEGSLVAFSYRDLQRATKNFSDKLGGGGFGSVFKGVLCDSSIVAVKKLESVSQGDKQFRSEVSTIGTIQHVNLVRLRGFCAQSNNKLLVYDYMPNGSLHSHLFREKQDDVLTWETRYQIALGTARGLVYLHERCRDCIIHCDIKPENILLDANFCPKVADFGLAKLVGREFSRVLTTIRGTRGYLASEWLSGEAVTTKADVFSYGMVLFELVTGKRNIDQSEDLSFTFFPSLAANVVMKGGDILSLLDCRLSREASVEQVARICKVAYWSIQDEVDSRLTMSQVEQILEGALDVKMPPIPQSVNLYALV